MVSRCFAAYLFGEVWDWGGGLVKNYVGQVRYPINEPNEYRLVWETLYELLSNLAP